MSEGTIEAERHLVLVLRLHRDGPIEIVIRLLELEPGTSPPDSAPRTLRELEERGTVRELARLGGAELAARLRELGG